MHGGKYVAHAQATAICVDLALDRVEADIRKELDLVTGPESAALRRILAKLLERRAEMSELVVARAN